MSKFFDRVNWDFSTNLSKIPHLHDQKTKCQRKFGGVKEALHARIIQIYTCTNFANFARLFFRFFFKISQPNFAILLILKCSFRRCANRSFLLLKSLSIMGIVYFWLSLRAENNKPRLKAYFFTIYLL